VLRLEGDERSAVHAVVAAAAPVDEDGEFGLFARTARELGEHFEDDPGILAALLMNRVALQPGQGVFLPAGNLHAYLNGAGVEIMANSDNVMRGGLTAKHVDADELLAILDFTPGFPGVVDPVEESPGLWRYRTPAPEFALWRLEPRDSPVEVPASSFARVLLVVDGSVTVSGGGAVVLARGQAAFARAGESLEIAGSGTVYVAGPGLEG
jgi:mannose-6-phosphate isomerase